MLRVSPTPRITHALTYLGGISKLNIPASIITKIPILGYLSVSVREEVSVSLEERMKEIRGERRGKREEGRGKRKKERERRRPTIMIHIPRHITLIIINENNKFSNDQDQKSYYACDVYQEGYVHEYTGEEPFRGPFVCHCSVIMLGKCRRCSFVGCEYISVENCCCWVFGLGVVE